MREWFDQQLNIRSRAGAGLSPLNIVIVGLILLSVVLFTLESEPRLDPALAEWIGRLNLVILILFAAEFALRIWSAGQATGIRGLGARATYAGRSWLAIDFIAFAPELLLVILISALGDQYALSIGALKVVRLLRLIKLAHFVPGGRVLVETIYSVRNELLASVVIALGLIYGSAVLIYLTEHEANPNEFGSVLRALWWSVVTLTTVGYGDVYPSTVLGRISAGAIAIAGVGLVALPSGILAGAFIERMRDRKEGVDH